MILDILSKPILILGCGNPLLGDDGFGPAVIDHLHLHHTLPECAAAADVGTSLRSLLFDILLVPVKPRALFIVDAVCMSGRSAGEVFELDVASFPSCKSKLSSPHQHPSLNLLNEIREHAGISVRLLVVQAENIPDEVRPGLSDAVKAAVPEACRRLLSELEGAS